MAELKTIIVDDEMHCRENLKMLVEDFCDGVTVAGLAKSAEEARSLVEEHKPDVVFLDVMMPNEDGFAFLKSMVNRDFAVIFTTAHDEFALKAIKESAVDYLEKPINIDELMTALAKLQKSKTISLVDLTQLDVLIKKAAGSSKPQKLAVPTSNGLVMVNTEEIIHLEASESYTTLFLSSGKRLVSSKTIKVYEDHLSTSDFYRVHKSHIINVSQHLREFSRTEGNMAIMSNGTHVPVSRRKVTEFVDFISTF